MGQSGTRSLARSALVEAIARLTRALDQIATLPATPALRREADQTSGRSHKPARPCQRLCCAGNQGGSGGARLLIEKAEALEEPPEDPLLLFSVLYGFWVANFIAFNGDLARELAAQFFALAEKQRATVPLMIGHRLMATSFSFTGDLAEGRPHYDRGAGALRSC